MTGTDWSRFRVESISVPTFVKRNLIHADLLRAVAVRASGGVLEVGIGSGAQSALLSRFFPTVALDNDFRIISLARGNVERFGPRTRLVMGDAFALPFRDGSRGVAVSQGLMEHFEDDRIGQLLREQLRVCRSAVFSVPSDRYPRQDVGDERLLSPAAWDAIVRQGVDDREYRIRARYYGFDLERLKYSLAARRDLGGFNVLVTVDRR